MQKLPKQKEILLGKDLKDLGLPGVIEEEIIVAECSIAVPLISLNLKERPRPDYYAVSFFENCYKNYP